MGRADLLEKTHAVKYWRQKEKEAKGEEWDGKIASMTQWTWIWTKSKRLWRMEEPGFLLSMGLQRVGRNLATEPQQQYFIEIEGIIDEY